MPRWGLQSLQAVWYAAAISPQSTANSIYSAVVGTAPTAIQSNPTGGLSLAQGQDAHGIYRVQIQGGRVDFFHNPLPASPNVFPLFSDFDSAMNRFRANLPKGSATIGSVDRIAMVVNTSEEQPSPEAAAGLILPILNITLPFQDGRELIFQINRKRQFQSIAGIDMFRIMKWQSDSFSLVNIVAGTPQIGSANVATLTVDVSSASPVTPRQFTPAEQDVMFQEIGDEVERLCNNNTFAALA